MSESLLSGKCHAGPQCWHVSNAWEGKLRKYKGGNQLKSYQGSWSSMLMSWDAHDSINPAVWKHCWARSTEAGSVNWKQYHPAPIWPLVLQGRFLSKYCHLWISLVIFFREATSLETIATSRKWQEGHYTFYTFCPFPANTCKLSDKFWARLALGNNPTEGSL